jgi:hypothetical protein
MGKFTLFAKFTWILYLQSGLNMYSSPMIPEVHMDACRLPQASIDPFAVIENQSSCSLSA